MAKTKKKKNDNSVSVKQWIQKIVTKSKNGKSVTTINGEEVVPKKYADELYETLESVIKKLEVNTLSMTTSKRVSSAMKSYDKHKRSSK